MTDIGTAVVRLTIWAAVAGYGVAIARLLWSPGGDRAARAWWTAGCGAYVLHVLAAFHFFYQWSHGTGIAETARQTAAMTGVSSGGGLYFNYAFTLCWLGDALFWWAGGLDRYHNRHRATHGIIHAFMFFMVINGTVVFGRGISRWIGAGVAVLIAAAIHRFYSRRRASPGLSNTEAKTEAKS